MIQHLTNGIQGSAVRAFRSEGGWIIEIIHPRMTAQRAQIVTQLEKLLNNLPAHVEWDIVWKLFLYSTAEERFKGQGTLHTEPEEHDQRGASVVTLAASDTYINLTEFDCEILSFCAYHGIVLQAQISVDASGTPILPYVAGGQYVWLEAMGGNYGLAAVSTIATKPGYLNLTLHQ